MSAHIFFLQSGVCKKILYNKVLSYTKIAFYYLINISLCAIRHRRSLIPNGAGFA